MACKGVLRKNAIEEKQEELSIYEKVCFLQGKNALLECLLKSTHLMWVDLSNL